MEAPNPGGYHLSAPGEGVGGLLALDQTRVNRLWEAVVHTSHEVVWEMDTAGVITFANGTTNEMLGSPPSDLVGRSVFSVIHREDLDEARAVFAACLARRAGWRSVRLRALRSDGSNCWVESSGVAHLGADGILLGFTATTRRLDADTSREQELGEAAQRIEAVLEDRSITTVWQPIFSVAHGEVIGVEALSRFPHRIARSPDVWFAEAFSVGRGVDLEMLAVETALRASAGFPEGVYISVNLSAESLADGRTESVLAASPVPADRLVVELTEHASIDNYEAVCSGFERLRSMGVRLAVDDAGAGFASFRHILRLGPDIVKLDRSITDGIATNAAQRALATAVVLFALEVGSMTVTAEGVETAEDLTMASSLGLDAVQGFHVGRPVPAADLDWGQVITESWRPRRA